MAELILTVIGVGGRIPGWWVAAQAAVTAGTLGGAGWVLLRYHPQDGAR